MLETAKAFAWARKAGTAKERPVAWSTTRKNVMLLAVFAKALERLGHASFAAVTPPILDSMAASFPNRRYYQKMLGQVAILYGMDLPGLPAVDPFLGRKAHRIIRNGEIEDPTMPVPDNLLAAMVDRCLGYEQRLDELIRLRRTEKWEGPTAEALGVRGRMDFEREWRFSLTAGCIMVLTATGMRCSELLSLERGALDCDQAQACPVWRLWGTVYKFHGDGLRTRWLCGRLGRRGYHMLARMAAAAGRKRLVTYLRTGGIIPNYQLNIYLKRWMAAQGWRDSGGLPFEVCSHQFRPTFARQAIRSAKVNLMALKDHFKHHDINMTDHYVQCDEKLVALILDAHPGASKAAFEAELRRASGLEAL
jgi:integrase